MAQVRDIVVIAARLGGISALARVAQGWPAELQTSALVALDTPEQPATSVLQIIASYAPVPATFAVHGEPIKPRQIYLSPPGKHLLVCIGGGLIVDAGNAFDSTRPSVNRLFASAAAVFGPRVIGIILSGHAKDGVQGMYDIAEAGGIGIVQEPDEATQPYMPLNVIRRDHPRYVMKAREIGPMVKRLMMQGQ